MTNDTEGCTATQQRGSESQVGQRKESQCGEENRGSYTGPAPAPTHMGDANAAVDGEGRGQVFIELAEPWSVDLVHQLSHTDNLWG